MPPHADVLQWEHLPFAIFDQERPEYVERRSSPVRRLAEA